MAPQTEDLFTHMQMVLLMASMEQEIKTERGRIRELYGNVQMCGYATLLHYDHKNGLC